jgi:hypothetical protein
MAQNVTVAGASYLDVPSILLPKTGGGTAQFDDTSDANATAGDIESGKTAYVNGAKLTGTGGGGLPVNSAVIHVSAPAGSTITFSKGGVIVDTFGPDRQHINSSDAEKADWFYPVAPANYGAWTITAAITNLGTGSYDVTVSEAKVYDVVISFGYLIYRNGWQHGFALTTIDNVFDPNTSYTVDSSANPPRATTIRGNWGFALNNNIDITNYNTLYVDIEIAYPYNYRGLFGLWPLSSTNARKFSDGSGGAGASVYYQHNSGIARSVYTLDISSVSGVHVFKAQQRDGGGTATGNYGIYLYDLYLK